MPDLAAPVTEPTPSTRRGLHAPRWAAARTIGRVDALFAIAGAVGLVFVLFMHGFLPGMSQTPLTSLMGTGAIQCLRDQGISSLGTWCMSLGLPVGAPRLTGLPEIYLGWFLTYVPGVDAWAAHQISNAALVTAGFVAGVALLRRWGTPRWVALLFTTSYMTAVNIIVLNGFEYTFLGYLLLPAYVWVALWTLDRMDAGRWVRAGVVVVALCVFMVFTEGYTFFGAGVVIGCLVLAWAWRQRWRRWARAVAACALWGAAVAGAAALYVAWAPEGAYETGTDLETFGMFGVDLVTLVTPRSPVVLARVLGTGTESLGLWGQSASIDVNYLGALSLALGLGFLVAVWWDAGRRRLRSSRTEASGDGPEAEDPPQVTGRSMTSELRAVAVAGVLALLLAFGPGLKVGQTAPALSEALLELPTAWLYANVPGFTEMRAVHRWLVVTRWCLLMLAAGGVTMMWRRWGTSTLRRVAIVVVGVLAVVEVAPVVPEIARVRQASIERVTFLRDGIVAEADELIEPGEVVLMLPAGNDFLANYLVPMVGARSYNVGIDKNYVLSSTQWPQDVRDAIIGYRSGDASAICLALETDVDAVVLTYINPSTAPLLRRQDAAAERTARRLARGFAQDPRFDAEVGEWLTVLRGSGMACTEPADD